MKGANLIYIIYFNFILFTKKLSVLSLELNFFQGGNA